MDRLDKASADVFPLRNIRAGHKYTVFIHEDSLNTPHLDYLAYETSNTDYVVFGFADDSVTIRKDEKPCTLRRMKKSAVINSSLWGAIMEQNLPYALAAEMEDIYQWTVDFFGIQKGDGFTVIYDERFIDEARTRSFYERGRWDAATRQQLYERAREAMMHRCLTQENMEAARQNARQQFTSLLRGLGYTHINITFENT